MTDTLVLPSGAVVVPGYGGLFAVTEDGRVFATRFGRYGGAGELKPWGTGRGRAYQAVRSRHLGRTVYVHRLIAEAFIPNPSKQPMVNHINGDKSDNRASNLEWCTGAENQQHAVAIGLIKRGADCKAATISESVARGVKAFLKGRPMTPGAQAAAARAFGVSKNVVQGIASGRTWRHV